MLDECGKVLYDHVDDRSIKPVALKLSKMMRAALAPRARRHTGTPRLHRQRPEQKSRPERFDTTERLIDNTVIHGTPKQRGITQLFNSL